MGNHGASGAKARAVTAGNRARKPADVKPGGSRLLNLSNWPVSRRLFTVIVLALIMGLVFGGLRIASAESSANQFGRVSQLATLGQRLSVLIQDLQDERDASLSLLANGRPTVVVATMNPLYARTNSAAAAVQGAAAGIGGSFPVNIQNSVTTVNGDIKRIQGTGSNSLGTLHATLNPAAPQDELAVIANYGAVISDMITLADQVAQGVSDASLTSDVRAFNALALAKEQASQQRALLNYSFSNPNAAPTAGAELVDANTVSALQIASHEELIDQSAFQQSATPAEKAVLNNAITSAAAAKNVAYAQELETNILSNVGLDANGNPANIPQGSSLLTVSVAGLSVANGQGYNNGVTFATLPQGAQAWQAGMGDDISALQSTETQIANNIASRASELKSGASQSALITGIITAIVLLLVLVATLLVARSLVLPLRRLRAGALDVASVQLPERVRQLSESPDSAATLDVAPIDVLTEDEIGQVARAFDQVHQEAVRLAGEEALLRTSFNAMFVNLSRRSQSLIERLARMIDGLEQNEDDPERLSNLFSMDHLVTRMRRNSENLLLLAGHEGARKWSESVSLADVARAATSEIEQYSRVILNVQPGVAVIGQAVSDVVHLLAELIENATLYSPKDTQVQVAAQELTSGGVLIEVTDKGIGVSEARLAEMNWRLDNPPTMDVSVSRHMGLFAVARLAERHRVRVRLRPAMPQGLTALVWLPDSVIERTGRTYGGTGGWQQPAAVQGTGGFQARRTPGQNGNGHGTGTGIGNGNGHQAVTQPGYGRHSLPMRATAAESPVSDRSEAVALPGQSGSEGASLAGTAQTASVPTSNWFRSRRTPGSMPAGGLGNTNAGARPFVGSPAQQTQSTQQAQPAQQAQAAQPLQAQPSGGRDAGTGGWPTAQNPGDLAADPVRGEETAAGLPMRVPKANLIPGSAAGAAPGGGNGRTSSRPGSTQESPTLPAPLPQRSPEMARSRLSGFQRGARRAEGQTPSAGEGTDR